MPTIYVGNIAQKVRKFVFGRLFLCCNNASGQYILYGWKASLFPFKWYYICEEHAFVVWAAELSMWVVPMKDLPNLFCQTSYSAIDSCLMDWMIEVWKNKTYWQFVNLLIWQTGASVACGGTIHSHNMVTFKSEINRLSNGIRFTAKKHCYNKEIITNTNFLTFCVIIFPIGFMVNVNLPWCLWTTAETHHWHFFLFMSCSDLSRCLKRGRPLGAV